MQYAHSSGASGVTGIPGDAERSNRHYTKAARRLRGVKLAAKKLSEEELEHNHFYLVGHTRPEHRQRYGGHRKVIVGGPYFHKEHADEDARAFKDHPHYMKVEPHLSNHIGHLPMWHEVEKNESVHPIDRAKAPILLSRQAEEVISEHFKEGDMVKTSRGLVGRVHKVFNTGRVHIAVPNHAPATPWHVNQAPRSFNFGPRYYDVHMNDLEKVDE